MIVHDLSADAVRNMIPVDLANATEEPPSPIGYFDFHDCVCGIGSFAGRPPWELHTAGDELLFVLAGQCQLTVFEGSEKDTRILRAGTLAIVPRGCWHNNDAPEGVTMLFMTPRVGNEHSTQTPPIAVG